MAKTWIEYTEDERYKTLSDAEKKIFAQNYLDNIIGKDTRFLSLEEPERDIFINKFNEAFQTTLSGMPTYLPAKVTPEMIRKEPAIPETAGMFSREVPLTTDEEEAIEKIKPTPKEPISLKGIGYGLQYVGEEQARKLPRTAADIATLGMASTFVSISEALKGSAEDRIKFWKQHTEAYGTGGEQARENVQRLQRIIDTKQKMLWGQIPEEEGKDILNSLSLKKNEYKQYLTEKPKLIKELKKQIKWNEIQKKYPEFKATVGIVGTVVELGKLVALRKLLEMNNIKATGSKLFMFKQFVEDLPAVQRGDKSTIDASIDMGGAYAFGKVFDLIGKGNFKLANKLLEKSGSPAVKALISETAGSVGLFSGVTLLDLGTQLAKGQELKLIDAIKQGGLITVLHLIRSTKRYKMTKANEIKVRYNMNYFKHLLDQNNVKYTPKQLKTFRKWYVRVMQKGTWNALKSLTHKERMILQTSLKKAGKPKVRPRALLPEGIIRPEPTKPEFAEKPSKITIKLKGAETLQTQIKQELGRKYPVPQHQRNSIKKHLGTTTIAESKDIDKLTTYLDYLKTKPVAKGKIEPTPITAEEVKVAPPTEAGDLQVDLGKRMDSIIAKLDEKNEKFNLSEVEKEIADLEKNKVKLTEGISEEDKTGIDDFIVRAKTERKKLQTKEGKRVFKIHKIIQRERKAIERLQIERQQIKIPKGLDRREIPYLDYLLGELPIKDTDFKGYKYGTQSVYSETGKGLDDAIAELEGFAPALYHETGGDTELFKEKVFADLNRIAGREVGIKAKEVEREKRAEEYYEEHPEELEAIEKAEAEKEAKEKKLGKVKEIPAMDLKEGDKFEMYLPDENKFEEVSVKKVDKIKDIITIENDKTHKVSEWETINLVGEIEKAKEKRAKITEVETKAGKQRTFETMAKVEIPKEGIKPEKVSELTELEKRAREKKLEEAQVELKPAVKREIKVKKNKIITYRTGKPKGVIGTYYGSEQFKVGGWKKELPLQGKGIVVIREKNITEGTAAGAPLADYPPDFKLDVDLKIVSGSVDEAYKTKVGFEGTKIEELISAIQAKRNSINVIHWIDTETGKSTSVDLREHTEAELIESLNKGLKEQELEKIPIEPKPSIAPKGIPMPLKELLQLHGNSKNPVSKMPWLRWCIESLSNNMNEPVPNNLAQFDIMVKKAYKKVGLVMPEKTAITDQTRRLYEEKIIKVKKKIPIEPKPSTAPKEIEDKRKDFHEKSIKRIPEYNKNKIDYLSDKNIEKFPLEETIKLSEKIDNSAEPLFRQGIALNENNLDEIADITERNIDDLRESMDNGENFLWLSKTEQMDYFDMKFNELKGDKWFEPTRQNRILTSFMDKYESWSKLPDILTVYRGMSKGVRISNNIENFTFDKSVAKHFAGKNGVIRTFKIHKDDIDWVNQSYLGHKESEAIVISPLSKIAEIRQEIKKIPTEIPKEVKPEIKPFPKEIEVKRAYSTPETKVTDTFRGGTWYSSLKSKLYDFTKIEGVGGKNILKKRIEIKNPLIIEDAIFEDGSFAVINQGYEDFIPEKYKAIANELWEKGVNSDLPTAIRETVIMDAMHDVGLAEKIAREVVGSSNKFDMAMDLVISKGLKEAGYDALILKDREEKHIFKISQPVEKVKLKEITDYEKLSGLGKQIYKLAVLSKTPSEFINKLKKNKIFVSKAQKELGTKKLGTWQEKVKKIELAKTHKEVEAERKAKTEKKKEYEVVTGEILGKKAKVYSRAEAHDIIERHYTQLKRGQTPGVPKLEVEGIWINACRREGKYPTLSEFTKTINKIYYNRKTGRSDLDLRGRREKFREYFPTERELGKALKRGDKIGIDRTFKVVNTQGEEVTIPKGEEYMVYPHPNDKAKVIIQDGKQVTIWEGTLKDIARNVTILKEGMIKAGGKIAPYRFKSNRLEDYKNRLKETQKLSSIPQKDIIPFENFEKFRKDGKITHETPRKNLDKILKEGIEEPFGYLGYKTKAEFVTKDAVILHIQIPEYAREGLSFGMRADEINANVDIEKEWIVRAIDLNTGKVLFGKEISKKDILALSQKVKSVLRPPSKKIAVSFGLLGNKRTSVPLFSSLFKHWVQKGTTTIVEPYGGAFTIGTHSIKNSLGYGLKEFHSNIYDKEKYIIIKAIQDGKYRSIKDKIKEAVDNLNQIILKEGQDKEYVDKVFTKFMKRYPNSFIGSKKWIDFVSRIPAGSEVINFDYIYGLFQRTFQDAINKFYPEETTDLNSAIKVALIERIGRFAGGGQSFIASSSGVNTGFKEVESNIFGKFGLIEGFKKTDDIFRSADRYKTKISLYNEDGVEFLNRFKKNKQTDMGYYLDPPYIGSETTYKGKEVKEELGKFGSAKAYYESHKMIFDFQNEGAKIALNNSQNKPYMKKILETITDSRAWIYKEGRTLTSLIVSPESIETIDKYFVKRKVEKGKLEPYDFTSTTEKGVNIYSDFFEVPEVSKKIKASYYLSDEEIQERRNIIKAIWTVARAKGFSNAKVYRIVKEKTELGTMTHRKMTPELLSKVLKSVKRIRPPTIDHKTVIKLKTEKRIKELKDRFIKEGYITEKNYQDILKLMNIREPFYASKKQFITNRQGIELIRKMFRKTPTIREFYGKEILDIPDRTIRDWRDYKLTNPQLIMDSKQKVFKRGIKEREKLPTKVLRNFSSVERWAEIIQRKTDKNVYDLTENLSRHEGYFELALEKEMQKLPKEYLTLNTEERELITKWRAGEDVQLSDRALKVAKSIVEYYDSDIAQTLLKVNRFQQWLENPARILIKGVSEKRLNELKTIWEEEGNLALIDEIKKTEGFIIKKDYKPDIVLSNSFPLYSVPGVSKGLLQSKLGEGKEVEKDALIAFERKLRSDYKILYLNDAIKEMADLLYEEGLPNHIKENIRTLLINYSTGLQQNSLEKILEWGISQVIKTALSNPLKWARNFPQRSMILPYTPPHLMPKMFFQVMRRSLLRGSIRVTKGNIWKKTPEIKKNSFLAHTTEEGALEHEFMGMKRHKILAKLGILGKLCKKYITTYGGVDTSSRWSIFDPVSINIMRAFNQDKSFRRMKGVLYWAHIPPELRNILRAEIDNKNYEYVALRIAEHMAATKTQWRYGRHEKSIHEQTSGGHLLLRVTTYGRSTLHQYIDDAKTCGEGIINKDADKFYKGFQAVVLRTALMYAIAKAFIIVFGRKKKYGYGWNPLEVLDVEAAGLIDAVTDLMSGVKDPVFMMTKQLLNKHILGTITDEELKKIIKAESKKLLRGIDTIPYRTIIGYRQILWMLESVYGIEKIKPLSDAYNKIIEDKGWEEKEIERNAWETMRHAITGTDTEGKDWKDKRKKLNAEYRRLKKQHEEKPFPERSEEYERLAKISGLYDLAKLNNL